MTSSRLASGTKPAAAVWPNVVEAMAEIGIPLSGQRPEKLDLEMQLHADWAITLGCGGSCPYVPTMVEDWQVPDPAGLSRAKTRPIRDLLENAVVREGDAALGDIGHAINSDSMLIRLLGVLIAAAVAGEPGALAQQRSEFNDGDAHGDAPYLVEEGWTALFNGRDLAGWHGLGQPNEWLTARAIFWDRLLGPTRLAAIGGSGDRMLNGPQGRTVNLATDQKFGDIELYLEFMLAKGSNSGVYLHGLYEVQIFDSYGSTEPMKSSDGGGIYHRWINEKGVGGSAPSRNASRRPGEWQSYDIFFTVPKFAEGKLAPREEERGSTVIPLFSNRVCNGRLSCASWAV